MLDAATLSCAAPTTSGQSINYLVEVAYQDVDAIPVVLPYYNASNPSQAYSGPGNNGVAQYTQRKGAAPYKSRPGHLQLPAAKSPRLLTSDSLACTW